MFKINGILAITNGETFIGDVILKGEYANGTKYFIIERTLVISTEKIIDNPNDEQEVLKAIEEGKLDFWPLTTFRGWKNIQNLKGSIVKKIEEDKQRQERKKKVQELESLYPDVPDDLKERIRNLDHYHHYSDDGKVWRHAQDRHDKVIEELNAIGKLDLYKEYRKLICSK